MSVEALADWVSRLRYEDLPAEVVSHAIRIITDTVGVALGGTAEPEVSGAALAAPALGGTGRATVLATGVGTSAYTAALLNGQAAISLELDEGSQWATNHPASHVLPAALATAQERGASGADLLVAFVAGYEAAARAGRAMTVRRAVHPFGTAMVVGAAAGVARLHGLSPATTTEVLRVAAAMTPASTQRAANKGATVRNLLTGMCSAAGVLAAHVVDGGVSGEQEALETVYGVVLGEHFDPRGLGDRLGGDWLLLRNYFKLHACSRWNHAPIEAMATLLSTHPLHPDDVEAITVFTYAPATRLDEVAPPNSFAAKHSIPYNVAVRIALGSNGVEAYAPEHVQDPVVRRLAARVQVVEDPSYTAAQPAVRAARVEVRTTDGRLLSCAEDRAPGGFDNPYPNEVLDRKFEHLVTRGRSGDLVEPLRTWLTTLPEHQELDGLASLLRSTS
jgi:2-methylcitrate dehydratase PrpD